MADDQKTSPLAGDDAGTDASGGVPILPGVPFLSDQPAPADVVGSSRPVNSAGRSDTSAVDDEPAEEHTVGDPSARDTADAGPAGSGGTPEGSEPSGPGSDVTDAAGTTSGAVRTASVPAATTSEPAGVTSGPAVETPAGPAVVGLGWEPSGTRVSPRTATGGRTGGPGTGSVRPDLPITAGDRSSRREKESGPEPASALTADRLLAGIPRPPASGWRRWLYTATFGRINVGDSDAVRTRRALEHRISVRLGERTRYVPVLSRKGGVGKTTVTTLLGMALADTREDRIIAMDANPDRGTLSDRSPGRADFTARQLVQNRYSIDSFAQLAQYVTRDGSRLHVLASDTDPAVAQAFDDSDYRAVTDVLSRYYSVVLTDSGTGMVHSVMRGTLDKADSVVLVSGGSVDEARLASETLSWLEAHGRQDLLAKAIVVINLSSGSGTQVDVSQIEQHFRSRVSTVVRIPYDRHLAEGSRVELAKLNPATRRAVTELAALVVDQLAS